MIHSSNGSDTPVKEGLRRNYYKTALLSQVALRSQTNACCEGLFCSQREQSVAAAIFAEGLDAENYLPTGTLLLLLPLLLQQLLLYEAKDSLPTKNFVELRSNDVGTTAGERGLIPGKV